MTTLSLRRYVDVRGVGSYASAAPPRMVEYAYYAVLFYGMLSAALGIQVPRLAGGALLVLAAFCVMRVGTRATAVFAPLRLPLACALSFLVVEATVHGGSLTAGFPRLFITWILALIIIQSLNLRRGFLHRGTLVFWVMGLIALPYLTLGAADVETMYERVSVDSVIAGDFNNPNGLGGWFGFCCVYFTITAIETRRGAVRLLASLAAVGCLYIVGLSVSRGALLGTAIGITIALRRLLGRGFIPLLIAIIVSGVIYSSGVFDEIISRYSTRGVEETGRFLVWPLAIQRFLSSPLLGVGTANIDTYVPSRNVELSPHNSFIWLALSAGIVPLALFVAWWTRLARNALSSTRAVLDGPFRLPLLAHTFIVTLVGDLGFMQPWGVMTLCIAMVPHAPQAVRRYVVRRPGMRQPRPTLESPLKVDPHRAHIGSEFPTSRVHTRLPVSGQRRWEHPPGKMK